MLLYEEIAFIEETKLQGEEYKKFIEYLLDQNGWRLFNFLQQWNNGDSCPITKHRPKGTKQDIYKEGDDTYLVVWNSGLGYASLSRVIQNEE
jgi:hypothetical protein